MTRFVFIACFLFLIVGCGSDSGSECTIDSDCQDGLICSLTGTCMTPTEVAASLLKVDGTECTGAVECQSGSCKDGVCRPPDFCTPSGIRKVTSVIIDAEDNGIAKLAALANPVIADGIADGSIALELWMFSEITAVCDETCIWGTPENNVDSGCNAHYSGAFLLPVPALGLEALVLNPQFDLTTGRLTGVVDKADLINQLPAELRVTADGLVDLDVDTDGDGEPDKASAAISVTLAE